MKHRAAGSARPGCWPRSTRPTKRSSGWPRPSISTTCWSTWWRSSRNTRTSAPSSTDGSVTCWSTNIKIRTWPSTPSSAHCRSIIPTSASPATPISRSTAGAAPTCRTSSSSRKTIPGCRVVTLERNYRSTKNIISVADHLIRFNRNRKPKALRTENPVGEPVELTVYSRETDEAEGVAARISSLVQRG